MSKLYALELEEFVKDLAALRKLWKIEAASISFVSGLPCCTGVKDAVKTWLLAALCCKIKGLCASLRLGGVRNYSVLRNDQLIIKGVNDVIDIASGKGGVGKSTTTVNLVVSLANRCGLKVGVLDADVYRPSVPIMMNIHQKPEVNKGSFDLLGHTVPVQAASLLLSGPFVDYWLTEKKVYAYNYTTISMKYFVCIELTENLLPSLHLDI
ncbi:hypothetical protein F3Y22_tig00111310pilonHSYRG00020 [Hibiscus syriacus]|uniref:Uncharacterized protein n=1 Tax=Hibiscus syriacus TaxID=106335 RepID=A0A6A2YQQ9_HIBSY|nr:hypothetical protein F3Y22_tig00111310pilonHSYRG00020 [Hibiscus syriacus]